MKSVALFGAATLFVFIAAAAVSVYGFDQFEHAWGRGGSLQVEAWLGLVGALIAMGAFAISSAAFRRAHTSGGSLVLGGVCAVVCIALCWVINGVASSAGPYIAFLLLVAVSALASFAGHRSTG
jgi:hypothetical protein